MDPDVYLHFQCFFDLLSDEAVTAYYKLFEGRPGFLAPQPPKGPGDHTPDPFIDVFIKRTY